MVPSKVEITLRKADEVAWGKLEDPNYKPEPDPAAENPDDAPESQRPDWDIDDDDISDSDEEWVNDTAPKTTQVEADGGQRQAHVEEVQNVTRKEVEEEMRRAMEHKKQAEEKLEELKRQQEEEGYEDMPELE